jgi:hypothetical protein
MNTHSALLFVFLTLGSSVTYAQNDHTKNAAQLLKEKIRLLKSHEYDIRSQPWFRIKPLAFALPVKRENSLNQNSSLSIAVYNLKRLGLVQTWNTEGNQVSTWISIRHKSGKRKLELTRAIHALELALKKTVTSENFSNEGDLHLKGSTLYRSGGKLDEESIRNQVAFDENYYVQREELKELQSELKKEKIKSAASYRATRKAINQSLDRSKAKLEKPLSIFNW